MIHLKKGSIIKRINFATSATTLGKKYTIRSAIKQKDYNLIRFYYVKDNGKIAFVESMKNWKLIKY